MTTPPTKHEAVVIETYPDLGQVVVRFHCDGVQRIEYVKAARDVSVGEHGTVQYLSTTSRSFWSFRRIPYTVRSRDGRFDYSNLDHMCVCGHTLGQHGGLGDRNCGVGEFGDDPSDTPFCSCLRFRKSRRKRP